MRAGPLLRFARSAQVPEPIDPRVLSTARGIALALLIVGAATGCATIAPVNRPIDVWNESNARPNLYSPERSGKILLALTFSGGGTRAAAFAYGVLQGLSTTPIVLDGEERSLLQEVDLISAVSGGSFTAAYFGLHGEGIFDDFESTFLRRNVMGGLALEMLRPRYWLGRLGDRSQAAARYYDRHLFHDATFADIQQRSGAPQIVINATDLSTAGRFPFTPHAFGRICSDFAQYPISEAVTASSAVPIVFPTIRLQNYGGRCGFTAPEWTTEPPDRRYPLRNVMREELLSQIRSIDDREFIHLLDGGISDNLGLKNSIAALAILGDPREALESIGHEDLELILVVTVNAEGEQEHPWEASNRAATAIQIVSGLSGAQMKQQNRLTINLARTAFSMLASELSSPARPVRFRYIELSFGQLADAKEQRFLSRIETSFTLSNRKIDRLIEAGRRLVRESPELAEALSYFDGQ